MEHLFITGNKYTYKVKLFDAYKLDFRRLLKNMLTASLRKVFMLTTPGKQSSNILQELILVTQRYLDI